MFEAPAAVQWQPADRPGQLAALVALLYAPEPADAEDAA